MMMTFTVNTKKKIKLISPKELENISFLNDAFNNDMNIKSIDLIKDNQIQKVNENLIDKKEVSTNVSNIEKNETFIKENSEDHQSGRFDILKEHKETSEKKKFISYCEEEDIDKFTQNEKYQLFFKYNRFTMIPVEQEKFIRNYNFKKRKPKDLFIWKYYFKYQRQIVAKDLFIGINGVIYSRENKEDTLRPLVILGKLQVWDSTQIK